MKQRIVLWGAVAALAACAVVLVVAAGGDDHDGDAAGAPRLPIDLASSGSAAETSAAAVDLAPTTYVASDDLPAMGGKKAAYRVTVDDDQVAAVAEALRVDGRPTENAGSWHVGDDSGVALDVYGPGGTWTVWAGGAANTGGPDMPVTSPPAPATTPTVAPDTTAPPAGGGTPGMPRTTTSTVVCIRAPCEPPAPTDPPETATAQAQDLTADLNAGPEPVQECPADPGGGSCSVPPCEPGPDLPCPATTEVPPTTIAGTGTEPGAGEPATPPPSGPLPPELDARGLAEQVLTAAGFDPAEATVEATPDDARGVWSVRFEPRLGGAPAPGLAGSIEVGAQGVVSGVGYFAPAEPRGDYPLLDTAHAIERLNTPGDVSAMASGATEQAQSAPGAESGAATAAPAGETPGADASGNAGAEPAPAPTPETTAVTDTTHVTGTVVAPDGGPGGVHQPAPVEVTLTSVELVYTVVPSWDGSGAYAVPSYRFTAEDGQTVVVNALADEAVRSPG